MYMTCSLLPSEENLPCYNEVVCYIVWQLMLQPIIACSPIYFIFLGEDYYRTLFLISVQVAD